MEIGGLMLELSAWTLQALDANILSTWEPTAYQIKRINWILSKCLMYVPKKCFRF